MSKNENRQQNQNNRTSRNCSYEMGIKVTMITLFKKINEKMNNLPANRSLLKEELTENSRIKNITTNIKNSSGGFKVDQRMKSKNKIVENTRLKHELQQGCNNRKKRQMK